MKNDGLIRLTYERLQNLHLEHLISGLDDDMRTRHGEGATHTDITGYTEWVTRDPPCVTLGWDWIMQASTDASLRRVGEPRSNLMLMADDGMDLGHATSSTMLEQFIDHHAQWPVATLAYLDAQSRLR